MTMTITPYAHSLLVLLATAAQSGVDADVDRIQEASVRFFLPVIAAYLVACGGWLLLARVRLVPKPAGDFPSTDRRWLDLIVAFAAAAGVFLMGWMYREGYLLPPGSGWRAHLSWNANNLLIYAPVLIAPALRRQSYETIFLSSRDLGRKVLAGALLALVATFVYFLLRGQPAQSIHVLADIFKTFNLANFLPVFLEGVALAFLFVRLRWVMGLWPAVIVPCVLFAVAHVPRQLERGATPGEIAAFFVLNTALPAVILLTVYRSRDVIWLTIVHYVMDIAIHAFHK